MRRAFNLAFPFEELNKTIFYGLYDRPSSYFYGLDLASSVCPKARLQILGIRPRQGARVGLHGALEPVNDFPRSDPQQSARSGSSAEGSGMGGEERASRQCEGRVLTSNCSAAARTKSRVFLPYKASLDRLGSPPPCAPWTTSNIPTAPAPSTSISRQVSGLNRNLPATSSASSGALAGRCTRRLAQPDWHRRSRRRCAHRQSHLCQGRDELVAATKARPRSARPRYVVPQWTSLKQRTARWNRYSHPETMPRCGRSSTIWVV